MLIKASRDGLNIFVFRYERFGISFHPVGQLVLIGFADRFSKSKEKGSSSFLDHGYDACAGYPIKLIYLDVDKKLALRRIKEREERGEGSGCDEQTFDDFEKQLEVPTEDEPVGSLQ